ncbi:DUF4365 domain-containing protein [Methylobacterium hispanicum]|uniref:DUF4365 domain-containing protein n=1 Tax=Methylobacterium TaxID=407 RepID=UPI0009ECB243|nr:MULTISPECIES: DUF4365 domain-containing protein [Methylobacterium]
MITIQHTQECLSLAYVHAIAGRAGANLLVGRVHDYGVDGSFRHVEIFDNGRRVESGTAVDFQLKATTRWSANETEIIYDLEAKTFNDFIRRRSRAIPFILIVLCLHSKMDQWLTTTEDDLVLRQCCYWFKPTGAITLNPTTIRIKVPRVNIFTAERLATILEEEAAAELELEP